LTEAKAARAELLVEVKKGHHGGASMTVDELCEEWLRELERKGRAPRTVAEYQRRYEHDIRRAIGHMRLSRVTTKMLTDLYGAHQQRGAAPASIRKIHATVSSMMSQACRWGWLRSNPAEWADPPAIPETVPTAPTPQEVLRLIEGAERSKRPEHAGVLYIAASTGARRGEICAIRRSRINWDERSLLISRTIFKEKGEKKEGPTKNRKRRTVAVDDRVLEVFENHLADVERAAAAVGCQLIEDPYVFSLSPTGDDPWDPDTITQFFRHLRSRLELDHLEFKGLRRFMDTYGQELGFSLAQVSIRSGHDPAVASKHYTGRVSEADRELAAAMFRLLRPPTGEG
jgi:integrase